MNMRSIEARLSQIESKQKHGLTDWERRKRECAEHTMRETIETYGAAFYEWDHPGEPYTDECRAELLAWADEYDRLDPQPTLEETLKEYGEIMNEELEHAKQSD